jgi:two-component system response regulator
LSRLPIILLVDDDDDHLFVAERALTRAGIQAKVCMAHDGKEALRVLDQETARSGAGGPVALVMLDVRMPGMSGMDMLGRIRADERTRAVPVVVISSSDRAEEVREAYGLGANSYVVKRYGGSPGAYLAEIARYWIELNPWADPGRASTSEPGTDRGSL